MVDELKAYRTLKILMTPIDAQGSQILRRLLKGMIWMIIVTFTIVVFHRSVDDCIEWQKVLKGFLPLEIPTDKEEPPV